MKARKIVPLLLVVGLLFLLCSNIAVIGHAYSERSLQNGAKEAALVNSPLDVRYYYGSMGNTITWSVESSNLAGTSLVYRNDTVVQMSHSGVVTVNIDGLDLGVYNYTIRSVTYHGDYNGIDTVMVFVEPHPNPMIQFAIENLFFTIGLTTSIVVVVGILAVRKIRKSRK